MNKQQTDRLLTSALARVLEQVAFMFPDDDKAPKTDRDSSLFMCARVGFTGNYSGVIELRMPENLGKIIAANMLGSDDPDELEPDSVGDAVKEFTNIVTGQFLSESYGRSELFTLSPPTLVPEKSDPATADDLRQEPMQPFGILVDGYPLLISLRMLVPS